MIAEMEAFHRFSWFTTRKGAAHAERKLHRQGVLPVISVLIWLIAAAALVIGLVLYRSRSGSNLNVTPHAREVIEKAKRR